MPKPAIEDAGPGEQLYSLLESLVPRNDDFPSRVDELLRADDDFAELLYRSTLLYVTRRLVRAAQFIARRVSNDNELYQRLRQHLRDEFELGVRGEAVLALLVAILQGIRAEASGHAENQIKIAAERSGVYRCYLCGCEFNPRTVPHKFEHHWPRSLGGVTSSSNLRLACDACNGIKGHILPDCDVHYEHLAIQTVPGDDSFLREFNHYFRLAVQLRSQSSCYVCGISVGKHGPMRAARVDTTLSWHYLNVALFCEKHYPAREATV